MGKRSWDEINEDIIRAMNKLDPKDCTTTNIHRKVGKFGMAESDGANTSRLLHRMRKHGLVEQTYTLLWVVTPAGQDWFKERHKEKWRKHFGHL